MDQLSEKIQDKIEKNENKEEEDIKESEINQIEKEKEPKQGKTPIPSKVRYK